MSDIPGKYQDQLDHLFRTEYRRLVSILSSRFGSWHIESIEDAVQDALLKAARLWGYSGMPRDPSSWLYRVAHNALIDRLRKNKYEITDRRDNSREASPHLVKTAEDNQLMMIFACCHPGLSQEDQLILSLKILGGLGIREIAAALLKGHEAVKKQYQRARQRFKEVVGDLTLPSANELTHRLESVLKVIYLLFNEGYKSSGSSQVINRDICEEALVLALMLQRHEHLSDSRVNALIALICFNMARFDSRISPDGEIITLPDQDRGMWDRELIQLGFYYLRLAQQGEQLSTYHLEALVAATHISAPNYDQTDWHAIIAYYEKLHAITGSPMVKLNQVVALMENGELNRAEYLFNEIKSHKNIKEHYLTYSTGAELMMKKRQISKAKKLLAAAIQRTTNKKEKEFLVRKMNKI